MTRTQMQAGDDPEQGKRLGLQRETLRDLKDWTSGAAWPCSDDDSSTCESADCETEE